MELKQGTCKSSKFEPQDFISCLPGDVVANILDRLSLQEAVRTGILAKNWRFKWTLISKLVFDVSFYECLVKAKAEKNYGKIIGRLLLHLKGDITKFVIYIEKESCSVLDEEDITHWILFLSGKGIKDLTIHNVDGSPPLNLPNHLFSCMGLKHLELFNCCFYPPASFRGFPNLLSLELHNVGLESGKFGQLLTHCPILEILKMGITHYEGKVKLVEIAKLTNLKLLSFFLCNLEDTVITSSSIFELLGCLLKLQELELDFTDCEFIKDDATKKLPITFPYVKKLMLSRMGMGMNLACAFEMIRRFPNLQSLNLHKNNWNVIPQPKVSFPEVDYSTMGMLQLQNVVFTWFQISEDEVCFVKYLLACSPFLKWFYIHHHWCLASYEDGFQEEFAKKLLEFRRASPVAEIELV